ncbi:hypothetical protein BJ138DRAFT_1098004 [Hygrophoropsis aurantiaca]|uniref:Uncharacterized protein n=1 Tax=Hygrophoropsis aurantiaca TaxID=72124 RepID=A0ACB8APR1_9AGAM|nr:hypothetical protein BJ138DRAFT_1098004 [Hygrophoropsis aurantiaca]
MYIFRLSEELILLILEELEPASLLRFCQASHLIRSIASGYTALRYRYELALCTMKDGPPSNELPRARLEQLLHYKRGWPTLSWSTEDRLRITPPTIMGVAGRFLYHASENSLPQGIFQWTLQIFELRSYRTALTNSLRHRNFSIPFDIRQIAIDPSQDLLVLADLPGDGAMVARLHFLNIWTCHKHHRATQLAYHFRTDWWGGLSPGQCISVPQIVICGKSVGFSVRLEVEEGEGTTELIVINWDAPNLRPRRYTGDIFSFDIINESCLVVASHPDEEDDDEDEDDDIDELTIPSYKRTGPGDGIYVNDRGKRAPQINIHDLHDDNPERKRTHEFPESWGSISFMRISPNSSLRANLKPEPGSLFFSDPSQRLFALSIEFPTNAIPAGCSRKMLVVLNESMLQFPQVENGEEVVPWNEWRNRCMVLNMPDRAEGFQAVGRRILFFENVAEPWRSAVDSNSRLHLLDLNPHAFDCLHPLTKSPSPWTWKGPWTTLTNTLSYRSSRYIQTSTVDVCNINWVDATEDSIILYNECEGQTSIRILTFGSRPSRVN